MPLLEYRQVRLGCQAFSFDDSQMPVKSAQPFVPQSVGERIAHARRVLGVLEGRDLTPPDIAERVGVTAASVYNWEGNTSIPGDRNLERLAQVLGVTPAYLRYASGAAPGAPPTNEEIAAMTGARVAEPPRSVEELLEDNGHKKAAPKEAAKKRRPGNG